MHVNVIPTLSILSTYAVFLGLQAASPRRVTTGTYRLAHSPLQKVWKPPLLCADRDDQYTNEGPCDRRLLAQEATASAQTAALFRFSLRLISTTTRWEENLKKL